MHQNIELNFITEIKIVFIKFKRWSSRNDVDDDDVWAELSWTESHT